MPYSLTRKRIQSKFFLQQTESHPAIQVLDCLGEYGHLLRLVLSFSFVLCASRTVFL